MFDWIRELLSAQKIQIEDTTSTMRMLLETNNSFARYGDGELALMHGLGIAFQNADPALAARLRQICRNPGDGLAIGIPRNWYIPDEALQEHVREYDRNWMRERARKFKAGLNRRVRYYDSYVTLRNQISLDAFDRKTHFSIWRRIWTGKKILLVCGESVRTSWKADIFDCAADVELLMVPSKNAWSEYDTIFSAVKVKAQDRLVLAILGPTATVLAADCSAAGIRCLDIGHLGKDYDGYCQGVSHDRESTAQFFRPD